MKTDTTTLIREIEQAKNLGLPFVIYKKPGVVVCQAYIQNSTELHELADFHQEGFLFAPYQKRGTTVLFPAVECQKFSAEIRSGNTLSQNDYVSNTIEGKENETTRARYCSLVNRAVQYIKEGHAEKIVLSRKETVRVAGLNSIALFQKMMMMYPNAFCYLWWHPQVGEWMGATPETLLHVNEVHIITMALAGTKPYVDTLSVSWGEKEKIEQAFVTDFVMDRLGPFLEKIQVEGPFTAKAGSVVHLRTDMSGILTQEDQVGALVTSLHPTPAICGIQRDVAADFITANEGYDRSFYTGYLGELNGLQSTALYVNLRCMELLKDTINLFIGGGITSDSVPEKEWIETVQKAAIMKNVLSN